MNKLKLSAAALALTLLSGCAAVDTVKKYWPKAHDPVMFNQLVQVDTAVEHLNCDTPTWDRIAPATENLAKYAEWRRDPQAENMRGLHNHIQRMTRGGSKTFFELGKKTASQRIAATKSAWEGR